MSKTITVQEAIDTLSKQPKNAILMYPDETGYRPMETIKTFYEEGSSPRKYLIVLFPAKKTVVQPAVRKHRKAA